MKTNFLLVIGVSFADSLLLLLADNGVSFEVVFSVNAMLGDRCRLNRDTIASTPLDNE